MNYCILLHIDRESHFVILSFLHILVLIFVLLGFFSFLFFCLFDFFLAWLIPRVRFTKPIFPIISLGFLSVSFCSPFKFFFSLSSYVFRSPHFVQSSHFTRPYHRNFFYSFIYPFIHFTFLVRPQPARSDLVRPFLPSRFPVVADSCISGVKDTLRIH